MLQQWHDFCGREETNYFLSDVTSVLKIFTELYEKGCQYSSINLARSALASVVTLRGYATLSDRPLIKRFMKGVFHLRPPKPKYSSIWDPDILLRYWQKLEVNSQLNLLELSKKVTTLLGSEYFANCNIWCQSNHCVKWHVYFYSSELLKHDQQGRARDKFIYKKFENSKLCAMAATKEYLKWRAEHNVAHRKFLFTTASPYSSPHKGTIARWVKNTLSQVGVNTNIFSSHSCISSHRFIYEGLVRLFINDLSRYKQQFNTLKGFEIWDCILLISKRLFSKCYVFSKNMNR